MSSVFGETGRRVPNFAVFPHNKYFFLEKTKKNIDMFRRRPPSDKQPDKKCGKYAFIVPPLTLTFGWNIDIN